MFSLLFKSRVYVKHNVRKFQRKCENIIFKTENSHRYTDDTGWLKDHYFSITKKQVCNAPPFSRVWDTLIDTCRRMVEIAIFLSGNIERLLMNSRSFSRRCLVALTGQAVVHLPYDLPLSVRESDHVDSSSRLREPPQRFRARVDS